jgi:hypothetical protein
VILIAVAGCGGVTSQDGEGGDSLTTHPIGNPCHIFNPGYISLDGFDAGPRRTVGGAAYETIGEPLWVRVYSTAHATYPGSGPTMFDHPIVLDGTAQSEKLIYANGLNTQQSEDWMWGATVSSGSSDAHTVSLSSACGTETRTLTTSKIAATAPVPSLNVSSTYINPGTPVTLSGSSGGFSYATCLFGRAHLVGKQDYDNKVVLDETYEPNQLLSWSKTVKPEIDTTYTLTMSCALASYAAPQTVSKHVQVYGGGAVCGGATPGTWQFCQSCPSNVSFYPPWTTTLIETACSYDDAKNGARAMGSNCSLTDGPCS